MKPAKAVKLFSSVLLLFSIPACVGLLGNGETVPVVFVLIGVIGFTIGRFME